MKQIVERQNKSVFKIFFIIIGFVILINFTMFIVNRYVENLSPYIANIVIILLVVISCSFILIKYFSKYSYTIEENQLVFYRVIGKRKFEMLRINHPSLIYIRPYKEDKKHTYAYNFTFNNKEEKVYVGKFLNNNERTYFLFTPNEQILKGLNAILKTRSEKNG